MNNLPPPVIIAGASVAGLGLTLVLAAWVGWRSIETGIYRGQ